MIVDKVVHCECGFVARAPNEQALVEEVQCYAAEAHGMALSHDDALLLVFRAELDEAASAIAGESTGRGEKEER